MSATGAHADDYDLRFDERQIAGPDRAADFPAWLTAMKRWRDDERARIGYDDANYERPELSWASATRSSRR